jgi:DNA-binding GntR family transcriptional regulator
VRGVLCDNHAMAPSSSSLRRVSTVDALADAIRKRILSGELTPGAPVREIEVSEQYGVGRHSVRAALQALVHEGLLRHQANHGAFVPEFSASDVTDLFVLRTALEVEAGLQIVKRRIAIPTAAAAVEELEGLRGDEPWDEVTEIDLTFHRALIEALDSERANRVFASLQAELRLLLAQLQGNYPRPEAVGAEHRLVLDALLGRSAGRATTAVREHLDVGLEDILQRL